MGKDGGRVEGRRHNIRPEKASLQHHCVVLQYFLSKMLLLGTLCPKKTPKHNSRLCCAKMKDGKHYANLKT